jgi:hypothetical protein
MKTPTAMSPTMGLFFEPAGCVAGASHASGVGILVRFRRDVTDLSRCEEIDVNLNPFSF